MSNLSINELCKLGNLSGFNLLPQLSSPPYMTSKRHKLNGLQYINTNEYNKKIFYIQQKCPLLEEIYVRASKHETFNPIIKISDKEYKVEFNDWKHRWKSRHVYDVTFLVEKHYNRKKNKIFINLHIESMFLHGQKEVSYILVKDI